MNTVAIYELDDAGEALAVHFYCSHGHAEADLEQGAYDDTHTEFGNDDDWPDGTVCERCNVALVRREG